MGGRAHRLLAYQEITSIDHRSWRGRKAAAQALLVLLACPIWSSNLPFDLGNVGIETNSRISRAVGSVARLLHLQVTARQRPSRAVSQIVGQINEMSGAIEAFARAPLQSEKLRDFHLR